MKHKELIAAVVVTASLASVGLGSFAFAQTQEANVAGTPAQTNPSPSFMAKVRTFMSEKLGVKDTAHTGSHTGTQGRHSRGMHGQAHMGQGTTGTPVQQMTDTEREAQRAQHEADRAAMDTALANGDYTAFKAALANKPKPGSAPEITEAVFAKMVEAHKLRTAGDAAGAKKIMSELGFKKPDGAGMGMHGGMKKGMTPPNLSDAQKTAWAEAKKLFDAGKPDEAKKVLDAAGIQPPQRGSRGMQNTAQPTGTAAPSL